MRITEGRIAYDFLSSVNKSREAMVKLQSDLATGYRVQKVSDDPGAASSILRLQGTIDRNTQYQKNVTDGQGALESGASALDQMVSLLEQAKAIVVQSQDGQQTSSMMAYGDQLGHIIDEAINCANTPFNGKYLFSGSATTTVPYVSVDNPTSPPSQTVTYAGNTDVLQYPTGDAFQQQVSVPGSDAFGTTALFSTLISIKDSLHAGIAPSAADQAALNQSFSAVTDTASKIGSMLQGLDSQSAHLTEQTTQLKANLSGVWETDVAEATLQLKQNETMLNAALNAGAQIIPKSLVDYLK